MTRVFPTATPDEMPHKDPPSRNNQGRHVMRSVFIAAFLAISLSACGTPHRDVFFNPTLSAEKVEEDRYSCVDFGKEIGGISAGEAVGGGAAAIAIGGIGPGVVFIVFRNLAEKRQQRWNCMDALGYTLARVPRQNYRQYKRSGKTRHARMKYLWKLEKSKPGGEVLEQYFEDGRELPFFGAWSGETKEMKVDIAIDGSIASARVNCKLFSTSPGGQLSLGTVTWDGHLEMEQKSVDHRLMGQIPSLRMDGNSGCHNSKITLSRVDSCGQGSREVCSRLKRMRAERILIKKLVADFIGQRDAEKTEPTATLPSEPVAGSVPASSPAR